MHYPNYTNNQTLFVDNKENVDDDYYELLSATKNGYIFALIRTDNANTYPFIRVWLGANDNLVYEYAARNSATYEYIYTPMFPIHKGEYAKIQLGSNNQKTYRVVRFIETL